jgi:hypothetical protein
VEEAMKHRNFHLPILIIVLLLSLAHITSNDVKADVGVPPAQPASSLSPGEIDTQVQMVSEQVEIIIHEEAFQASVSADFQMHNNGEEDETIEVWFPFGERLTNSKGPSQISVHDFQAWVDGEKQEVAIENSDEWLIFWAHWPVSFSSGGDVNIKVSYTVDVDQEGFLDRYSYIMETGAGWQGPIEEALITIEAPYPLQELDEFLGAPAFFAWPKGYSVKGSSIRWDLNNLEPTSEDNIDFRYFKADAWNRIADGIDTLATDPEDWQAHYHLASGLNLWLDVHQNAVRAGFSELSPENEKLEKIAAGSYWKAVRLSPPDKGLFISAIQYFQRHLDLIEPRDLQEIYYQSVQNYPDNEQLEGYYREALEAGWIAEGPPPSPSPLLLTITPTDPTPTVEIAPEDTGRAGQSLTFELLAGLSFLGAAILLIFYAVRRRRG